MKKRIAVFSNAWNEKSLSNTLEGISEIAKKHDFDVFVFISHASVGNDRIAQREEKRIYHLPDLRDFDGAIMFSTTMNFPDLVQDIRKKANAAGIPLVNVGEKLEGCPLIEINNSDSMIELVEHLVNDHGVKDIEFIAGPQHNHDSNTRIDATRTVLQRHGFDLPESQIHYGDWSVHWAMNITSEIITSREGKLPDAFVCANDGLALGVCSTLEDLGLRVPEDVLVTGYDALHDGQVYDPALCTVERDDRLAGKKAFESLLSLINGFTPADQVIPGRILKNQSCGCADPNVDHLRATECKNLFHNKLHNLGFMQGSTVLSDIILNTKNTKDIQQNILSYFSHHQMFGTGTLYLLEDAKAKMFLSDKSHIDDNEGYSDELEVLVSIEKNKAVPGDFISKRELIPGYKKMDNVSKMYIFMPIHYLDGVFGYAVIEGWLSGIANRRLKDFTVGMNQTVDKLKQNMALESLNNQLQELYTKDALTGMYNRFGFATEGKRIFEECQQQQKEMVLMFADINRMKLINDYYGHLQGDAAIKATSAIIQSIIPKHWIAIRFGGDEFLILGQCDNKETIELAKEQIIRRVKEKDFPFYLSVSCGFLHFLPEKNTSMDHYIKKADEAMYEIKANMHLCDEGLQKFVNSCKER